MRILGISAFYHDSAAALVEDGEIVAAAQEERFTRKKFDARFPKSAIAYCLAEAGVTLDDVDQIAFFEKPFVKFERLLETYLANAPRGFTSFRKAMPLWIKEKLFTRRLLKEELGKIASGAPRLLFPEHHLSHAASAFYPSPFEEAAILTIDGVGEWATTSICHGTGNGGGSAPGAGNNMPSGLTGSSTLTTAGNAAAGNITLVEANALNTTRLPAFTTSGTERLLFRPQRSYQSIS